MSHLDGCLEAEMSHGLWEAEVDGVHLWPMIRFDMLQAHIDRVYAQNATGASPRRTWRQLWWQHMPHRLPGVLAQLYAPGRPRRRALFFMFKNERVLDPRTQQWVARLHGSYFTRLNPPLIFESNAGVQGRNIPDDPALRAFTFSQEALWTWVQFRSVPQRLGGRHDKSIRDFITRAAQAMTFTGNTQSLFTYVQSCVSYRRSIEHIAQRLARRLSSPIAFINNSTYGGVNGLAAAAMRRAGLRTFDVQHGMIGEDHPAYQYPQAVMDRPDHPAHQYLPDVLLTFGPWWAKVARIPVRLAAVGYPHLNAARDRLVAGPPAEARTVVVVSQGTVTERMVELTAYLAAQLPDYRFTFKPHPLELASPDKLTALSRLTNVQLETRADILEVIARHALIVGYNSTTLFEAVAFPGKRILFWKNDLVPEAIGQSFETKEVALALIQKNDAGLPRVESSALWLPDASSHIDTLMREFEPQAEQKAPAAAQAGANRG